MVEVFVNQTP